MDFLLAIDPSLRCSDLCMMVVRHDLRSIKPSPFVELISLWLARTWFSGWVLPASASRAAIPRSRPCTNCARRNGAAAPERVSVSNDNELTAQSGVVACLGRKKGGPLPLWGHLNRSQARGLVT